LIGSKVGFKGCSLDISDRASTMLRASREFDLCGIRQQKAGNKKRHGFAGAGHCARDQKRTSHVLEAAGEAGLTSATRRA
jgi:hypothetical protein